MRKITIFYLLGAFLATSGVLSADDTSSAETKTQVIKELFSQSSLSLDVEYQGKLLNDTMITLDGKKISLDATKGKFSLVSFVASWCPFCQAEMPSFNNLYEEFKENDLFSMMIIFIGEEKETVQTFATERELQFPVILDPTTRVARMNRVKSTPTTYLLDPEGNIITRHLGGFEWDSEEVIDTLKAAISLWEKLYDQEKEDRIRFMTRETKDF